MRVRGGQPKNKLEDKKTNAITALWDFCRAVVRDKCAHKESNVFGARFKGTKLSRKVVSSSFAEKGKPADVVFKEHTRTKQQEEYDLFVTELFMDHGGNVCGTHELRV